MMEMKRKLIRANKRNCKILMMKQKVQRIKTRDRARNKVIR